MCLGETTSRVTAQQECDLGSLARQIASSDPLTSNVQLIKQLMLHGDVTLNILSLNEWTIATEDTKQHLVQCLTLGS